MRITVVIADDLLLAAKQRATEQCQTLDEVIDAALRREVAIAARPVVPVFHRGTGPRPGVDLSSNRALSEVLDEGLDLDRLR